MDNSEKHAPTPEIFAQRQGEDTADDIPHISSLRTTASGFSQRRLLNWLSVIAAVLLVLTLVTRVLPGILPKQVKAPVAHPLPGSNAALHLTPGDGWQPTGPDWATDIVFTADGAQAYACGGVTPERLTDVAVYTVAQKTWTQLPSAATIGGVCHISVSPTDSRDVLLTVKLTDAPTTSQVFRTRDGGATWSALPLPAETVIVEIVWANDETPLLVSENYTPEGAIVPPTYSLFASYNFGSLTEIPAQQLVGHAESFGVVQVVSSGATVYASLLETPCLSRCMALVRSDDAGRHWSKLSPNFAGDQIMLGAAKSNARTLIGWAFHSESSMTLIRSSDGGTTWHELPGLSVDPTTSGGAVYVLPNGSIYAWCYAPANTVFALRPGASRWEAIGAISLGPSLAVQYDASRHAVALWGAAHPPASSPSSIGLTYLPLRASAP